MKTIYIVEGSTGAYSDRHNWLVRAFTNEAKAKEFAEMLDCLAKALRDALDEAEISYYYMNDPENSYILDRFPDLKKDNQFSMDYTGTSYKVFPCELTE